MDVVVGYRNDDFAHSPFILFYEITRACDLVCRHCRASASPQPHPKQLPTEHSLGLIDDMLRFPKPPLLVLSGGDPMKREDLFDVIRYGTDKGLRIAVTPSSTPLLTRAAVSQLKHAGATRMAMSIDGADEATHDGLRGVPGSFRQTLEIMAHARDAGLPLQVNTTVTMRNYNQIDAIAQLLATQGIVLWSVFFLVPVGRGTAEKRIPAEIYEEVFERLWENARVQPFGIKTTEAHHYRRYVLQHHGDPQTNPQGQSGPERTQRAPLGVNDGKGVMFVSHTGEIYPSGFMPLLCGRFPRDSVVDVYQNSPVFHSLREPSRFHGKCGICEFSTVCGGSRARAYAVTGDPLESEPDCIYIPTAWRPHKPAELEV